DCREPRQGGGLARRQDRTSRLLRRSGHAPHGRPREPAARTVTARAAAAGGVQVGILEAHGGRARLGSARSLHPAESPADALAHGPTRGAAVAGRAAPPYPAAA